LRLAYLTSLYPAVSHTFVLREAQALRDRGIEVETVSIRRARPETLLSQDVRDEAARTHVLLPPRPLELLGAHLEAIVRHPRRYVATLGRALRMAPGGSRSVLWQLFYFGESMLLWRHLRRRGIRHVHVHFANVAADVAMLTCMFADAPGDRWTWSFTLHGMIAIPTEFGGVDHHRLERKVEHAEFVVCISDFGRSQLMGLVDGRLWPAIHVVRCGVSANWLDDPPDRSGHDPGRFEVLHVGRLVRLKGQAVLLEALADLRARGVPAHLVIVGDGPERARLERLAAELELSDALRLVGAVGQEEIRRHCAAADAFCLSSFAEGVPVVLMEGMATGLPVVATRVGGVAELVEDGVSGLLVTPGRSDLIADALEQLWSDPDGRRRMGAAGRRSVLDGFLAEASAERLAELFERSLGDGGASPRAAALAAPREGGR
jgi:glycosyltransferase involved in cell wall biosynthesis